MMGLDCVAIFQLDGAPCHTAYSTEAMFEQKSTLPSQSSKDTQ